MDQMSSIKKLIHSFNKYLSCLLLLFAGLVAAASFNSSNADALSTEEFQTPTPNTSVTYSVETSSSGVMWFTKSAQKQIVKLNTDGSMVEYPMTTFGDNVSQVQIGLPAVGPDGNIWYLSLEDGVHSYLNRINPDGSINNFELRTLSNEEATPYLSHSLTLGPDGNFWTAMVRNFDEYYIAKYSPTGAVEDEIQMPVGSPIYNIKGGLANTMWYVRPDKIGKISAEGDISEYDMPTDHQAFGLELANDGNIWFTAINDKGNQQDSKLVVGKITLSGEITIYPTEEIGVPPAWTLDLGPDGNLWFTLIGAGKVAVVSMDGTIVYHSFSPLILMSVNKGPDNNIWALSYDQEGGEVIKIFVELDQEVIDEQIISNNLIINPPSSPRAGNTTIGVVIGALFVGISSLLFRYFSRDKTREITSPR